MGPKISCLGAKNPTQILMLSLDGAGKTIVLYQLKLGEVVSTIPTIGFNVEIVNYKKFHCVIWDIGGGDKRQLLWKHTYKQLAAEALIFVVDSNDRERIPEAAEKLHGLLDSNELYDAPVLLFANKQDLPDSMSAVEIANAFKLNDVTNRPWQIQACCALNGQGLYEGIAWLSNELSKKSTRIIK